jgi:hypothetical protein
MTSITKQILTSNPLLKVAALIFGYAFWLILAQSQSIHVTKKISLSFYMPQNKLVITAPTQLTIRLLGKRIDLQKIDFSSLGAHIDTSNLIKPGTYPIHVSPEHIFLPSSVKLVHYTPVVVDLELN